MGYPANDSNDTFFEKKNVHVFLSAEMTHFLVIKNPSAVFRTLLYFQMIRHEVDQMVGLKLSPHFGDAFRKLMFTSIYSCETLIILSKASLQASQQACVPSYIYTSKKARLQPQCSCTARKKIIWALELIGIYLGLLNSSSHNNYNNAMSQNHTVSVRGGLYPVSRQKQRSGCWLHQLCN